MTDQTLPPLLRSDQDGVTTLTLNRPKARNALTLDLMRALTDELVAAESDPKARVIVLAANGPAFCSGHDLKEMRGDPTPAAYARVFEICARLMTGIVRLKKPVIAKVQGLATAAGCQLVASADMAIAADVATFATPGVHIGLFCSTPMVALSRSVGRKAAMDMLLTGRAVPAHEAKGFGLVNEVVAPDALDERVDELARLIASKSSHTIAVGKEAFYRQIEQGLEEAYALTARVMTLNMLAADAEEGIDAFLAKRDPVWQDR